MHENEYISVTEKVKNFSKTGILEFEKPQNQLYYHFFMNGLGFQSRIAGG